MAGIRVHQRARGGRQVHAVNRASARNSRKPFPFGILGHDSEAGPQRGAGGNMTGNPPVLRRVKVEGLTVTVAEPPDAASVGARPPILLVHGMFGGAWYFERYQRFFAARGHATYALDLRGHGESRPVEQLGRVSVRDYIADAMTAASSLDRPIVIGHSMGGLLAQAL